MKLKEAHVSITIKNIISKISNLTNEEKIKLETLFSNMTLDELSGIESDLSDVSEFDIKSKDIPWNLKTVKNYLQHSSETESID